MNQKVTIEIDGKNYEAENIIQGKNLKKLSGLPESRLLFREISHDADIEIINDDYYTLESDMIFYSENSCDQVKVYIDYKEYIFEKSNLSGAELKELANIESNEFKLLKEVLRGADLVIEDAVIYHVENMDEFFTIHNKDFEQQIKLTILCIDENFNGRFNIHETLREVIDKVIEKLDLLIDINEYYLSKIGMTQELDLSMTIEMAGLKNGDKLQFVKKINGGGERR